jgi:hypothetical protein
MKTFLKIFFLAALTGLLAGCEKTGEFFENETPELKKAQVKVTVPFKADFTVWDHSDFTDNPCAVEGKPWIVFLTMIGEGNINHMGKITTVITFCCNGQTGEYWDTDVIFVAANGDELYATIQTGQILPNEGDNADYYQTYFNDQMIFNGGTGRFEGASGKAMTNAFVHDPDPEDTDDVWHTDFFSTGEITLLKGKK